MSNFIDSAIGMLAELKHNPRDGKRNGGVVINEIFDDEVDMYAYVIWQCDDNGVMIEEGFDHVITVYESEIESMTE